MHLMGIVNHLKSMNPAIQVLNLPNREINVDAQFLLPSEYRNDMMKEIMIWVTTVFHYAIVRIQKFNAV